MSEYKEGHNQEDEISLRDIFFTLWAWRGIVIGGLLLGVLLGLAGALVSTSRVNAVTEYFITLPVIANGRYPNGAEFSPQDLLSSEVMSSVVDQVGIGNASELRENLTIEFGSPITTGISEKYRQRLSARNLSAAEIDALNAAFLEELQNVTGNSLRLALDNGAMGISHSAARNILIKLPGIWSEIYTTQFRVFDDPRLPIALTELGPSISTTLGLVDADRTLGTIRQSLTILSSDNRFTSLQTSDGKTAFDAARRADDLLSLYLGPLLSARQGKDDLAELYIQQYKMEVGELELKLANLTDTITQIQGIMTRQVVNQTSSAGGQNNELQLDGRALETIVSLANAASLSEYLTNLMDQQQEMVGQQARLRTKILQMTASSTRNLSSELMPIAESEFKTLVAEYNELLAGARALNSTRGKVLYRPFAAPIEAKSNTLRQGATLIAASVFMALVLSMLLVFVLAARGRKPLTATRGGD